MLGINSFKTFYNNSILKNNNSVSKPYYAFNSSLAPLKSDTISFSGCRTLKGDISLLNNDEVCAEVRNDANVALRDFKKVINEALNPLIFSKSSNYDGIVKEIKIRIKTPESLKEKIQSELDYFNEISSEPSFDPYCVEDIKKTFGDIIGARVVLKRTEQEDTSKIIDALIEEVKKGNLKITKIQNYTVDNGSCLDYFNPKDLKRLQAAVNQTRSVDEPYVKYIESQKDTGYTALHIDVDLSNKNYPNKKNGYKAELQILGSGVEKLKEAEQYCYKLNLGKNIKGSNPVYKPYVDYYNKFMTPTEEYPNVRENFIKYTHRAFFLQRKRETVPFNTSKDAQLPTIQQCGLAGELPLELDFNKLAKIKTLCDELYFETKNMYK